VEGGDTGGEVEGERAGIAEKESRIGRLGVQTKRETPIQFLPPLRKKER